AGPREGRRDRPSRASMRDQTIPPNEPIAAPEEQAAGPRDGSSRPPALASGIELIGVYEDSGFKEPPYIARRSDGQVVQLPQLLYMVAEEIDGHRSYEAISQRVSERFGRGLSPDNVEFLFDEKLRPLGVVAAADRPS